VKATSKVQVENDRVIAGAREATLNAGASYARRAGVAHNVVNANEFEFRFVEIELK